MNYNHPRKNDRKAPLSPLYWLLYGRGRRPRVMVIFVLIGRDIFKMRGIVYHV